VFVNGTYLSKAINRAPVGYYYVHFPGEVPTRSDHLRSRLGVAGVKALSLAPRLPHRLTEVQAAFDRRVTRVEFVPTYTRYLSNSQFTASWVERLWGRPSDVLYPPVRPSVRPGDKAPLILVLGRFFDPSFGHSKKQHELLATFRDLHRSGRLAGWRLAIVGGCDAANRDYALAVKRAARGLPVEVHVNAPGTVVERLLGEASLYWHGAGLGEDAERHPERFEHFGISVVEAMAAGAVPLVFGAAGPSEIVQDGDNGRHWHTLDELAQQTVDLATADARRQELADAAVRRADDFSARSFAERLAGFVSSDIGA
jgi:glycosyltransferase involved in cell wall biosynthesis